MSLRRTDGEIDGDLEWSATGGDVFSPSLPWRMRRHVPDFLVLREDEDPEELGADDVDGAEPHEGSAPGDGDEDDELDGPDSAEDFYADALEDA